MVKIRGKNLTVAQRKALLQNGFSNDTVNSYMVQKVIWIEEGREKLSKFGEKKEKWTLIHKTTGEIKEIILG